MPSVTSFLSDGARKRSRKTIFPAGSTLRTVGLVQLIILCLTFSVFTQTEKTPDQLSVYNQAIYDSAVYKFFNLRELKPLKFDAATQTAQVVTLTSYGGYNIGNNLLTRDVWVTGVPEVQDTCKTYKDDLETRLRQLLGLSPASTFTNFVSIEVKNADVFRPATDPDPSTSQLCPSPMPKNCGQTFPSWISDAHIKWIANQMLSSYIVTEPTEPTMGYPWTHLGYTYNWRPGADKYGASEYVIRSGSTVKVTAITPYKTYCGQ